MFKRLFAVATASLLVLSIAGAASAATPNKLKAFGDGQVTITGAKSATLVNDPTGGEYGVEYSGVYVNAKSPAGKLLRDVDFGFTATGSNAGGAPRLSIPIDTNADGATDSYAFIDRNACGGSNTISTTSSTCMVYFDIGYANWDAFAAANPTYRMSTDVVFVIADQAGTYNLSNIDLN